MNGVIGAIPRSLFVGLALLVGALFLLRGGPQSLPPPVVATLLSDPRPLPHVTLTDQQGGAFESSDLTGQFSLLFFGFTHCPDICPLTLNLLASVHRDWSTPDIEAPEVVFVSVDPGRDNPARITEYLENFDSSFHGITGPRENMEPWLNALGVSVHIQPQPDGQPYAVTHNSTIYVVGPGAELLAIFSAPHDANIIATDFLKIRQHYLNDPSRSLDPSAS